MGRVGWLRLACVLYVLGLTVLLLAPDPAALFGWDHIPGPPGGRVVHLAFFTVLGGLATGSRWPLRSRTLLLLLGAYAVGTELLQSFVPPRTTDPLDMLENLLGLGLGTWLGGWWSRATPALSRRGSTAKSVRCPGSSFADSGTNSEAASSDWPARSVD